MDLIVRTARVPERPADWHAQLASFGGAPRYPLAFQILLAFFLGPLAPYDLLGGVARHFDIADQIPSFIFQRIDQAGNPEAGAVFPQMPTALP